MLVAFDSVSKIAFTLAALRMSGKTLQERSIYQFCLGFWNYIDFWFYYINWYDTSHLTFDSVEDINYIDYFLNGSAWI